MRRGHLDSLVDIKRHKHITIRRVDCSANNARMRTTVRQRSHSKRKKTFRVHMRKKMGTPIFYCAPHLHTRDRRPSDRGLPTTNHEYPRNHTDCPLCYFYYRYVTVTLLCLTHKGEIYRSYVFSGIIPGHPPSVRTPGAPRLLPHVTRDLLTAAPSSLAPTCDLDRDRDLALTPPGP